MVHREIEIDDYTDRILIELSTGREGGVSAVVSELAQAHQALEAFLDAAESPQELTLRNARNQAVSDFEQGRTISWENVKTSNSL